MASTHLKLFSKLDCFLKIEFVKHEFQPEIEFLKLDLCLTDQLEYTKLEFHAFKKNNPNGRGVG